MSALKLVGFDEDGLGVISTHVQDAVLRVDNMAFEPGSRRFIALLNRFDWQKAKAVEGQKDFQRRRCALRFDHVARAQFNNISLDAGDVVLELLAIRFEPTDLPSGNIELIFANECSIRLQVECIEAELSDLGQGWKVRSRPQHEG